MEYKVIVCKVKEMENEMNNLAKEGWRVLTVSPDIAKLYAVENDVWPKENEILDVKLTVIKTDYIMRKDIFGMQPLKKTFRAILCDDVCTASISK